MAEVTGIMVNSGTMMKAKALRHVLGFVAKHERFLRAGGIYCANIRHFVHLRHVAAQIRPECRVKGRVCDPAVAKIARIRGVICILSGHRRLEPFRECSPLIMPTPIRPDGHPFPEFLEEPVVEITAKQVEKLPVLQAGCRRDARSSSP